MKLGWTTVTLGEVADIERRGVDPASLAADTAYLGLEHIESGGRIIGRSTVGDSAIASTKFRFGPEHVLFGKLRPYLAKIAAPDFNGVCSTDILPIRPKPVLDASYLAHFLRQPVVVDLASARATGANLPRLSPAELARFELPLPPIEEQRRIAAILDRGDQNLSQVARQRSAVGQMPLQLIRRYSTGPLVRVGDIAVVTTGATPSRSVADYFGGDVPWVKTTEVVGDTITTTSELVTSKGVHAARLRLYPKASIVVAMYGQGATRGRVARLGIEATVNQACAVVQHTDRVNGDFLFWQLKASYERLRAAGRGGNQPNLNLELVRDFKLPMPTKREQESFAEAAKAAMALDRCETLRIQLATELVASLQARAFSGRL